MLDEHDDDLQLCADRVLPSATAAAGLARTALVPRLVARLYASADETARRRLLSCLVRPLGLLALAGVCAGAFGVLLDARHREAADARLEQLCDFSSAQIAELARFVEQVNPEALQHFATTWLNSGLGSTAFATAAVAVLLRSLKHTQQ